MTTFTDKETEILDIVTKLCTRDYSAGIDDILEMTNMTLPTVRGVLGTLTQKGRIYTESDFRDGRKFDDIFALTEDGGVISYGETV